VTRAVRRRPAQAVSKARAGQAQQAIEQAFAAGDHAAVRRAIRGHLASPDTYIVGVRAAARLALGQGRFADALRWADHGVRLLPESAMLWFLKGSTALRAGDPALAAAALRQAAALDPALTEAAVALGYAELALGRHDQARAQAARLLQAGHDGSVVTDLAEAVLQRRPGDGGGDPGGWVRHLADGTLAGSTAGDGPLEIRAIDDDAVIERPRVERQGRRFRLFPAARGRVRILQGRTELLGSPVDLGPGRALTGEVLAAGRILSGWAADPRRPGHRPGFEIRDELGGSVRIEGTAMDRLDHPVHGFHLDLDEAGLAGRQITVTADGRPLDGSPVLAIPPGRLPALQAAIVAALDGGAPLAAEGRAMLMDRLARTSHPVVAPPHWPAHRAADNPPLAAPVDVVICVHDGFADLKPCLQSVLEARNATPFRLIIVDDASTDPAVARLVERVAAGRSDIEVLYNAGNLGFVASANRGMAHGRDGDVVLLNSDTLVAPGWLDRLRAAAHARPDVGTATPLSNHATIFSFPLAGAANEEWFSPAAIRRLDALAAHANAGLCVEVPTGHGFCLYVRRDCLDAIGPLDERAFGAGYGEENDFCLRATRLGWRHVAAADVVVGHRGGASFGAGRTLRERLAVERLERRYPGYAGLIDHFVAADPLAPARARLSHAVLQDARAGRPAVLMITHGHGGGVAQHVLKRARHLAGRGALALVLRPSALHPGRAVLALADAADEDETLAFDLPGQAEALADALRGLGVAEVEIHHLLGHDPAVDGLAARLGLPFRLFVHDYALYCPRIVLVDASGRHCGEPDLAGCTACLAVCGPEDGMEGDPVRLRARGTTLIRAAASVHVPTAEVAERIARLFPGIAPPRREDWEYGAPPRPMPVPPVVVPTDGRIRVAIVGGLSAHKGFAVVKACLSDAVARDLPLEFSVVGFSMNDIELQRGGRAFVTGPYDYDEAQALIARENCTLALFPALWPEVWCYALSEVLASGLPVLAFAIGAFPERLAGHPRAVTMAPTLDGAAVNDAILALAATLAPDRRQGHG